MDKASAVENPLGYERVGKLLARYAIPSIISLIINSLYNMVDQIFIGQGVGFLGNGATNIIAPIATIAIAVSTLFGDGVAAYFSLHLGKGVVLVYKCGQKKLNNLYYQVKEQRRRSTWRKTKNLTLRNLNNRLWICIMPEEPRIHNWNVNMA